MRGKDLLTALQIDRQGALKELTDWQFVYIKDGEKITNKIELMAGEEAIILKKNDTSAPLSFQRLVTFLEQGKEARLYVAREEKIPIYGYKLAEKGIVLG